MVFTLNFALNCRKKLKTINELLKIVNPMDIVQSQEATKNFFNWANLFLYYEESLVSSKNSKLVWFHSVKPKLKIAHEVHLDSVYIST